MRRKIFAAAAVLWMIVIFSFSAKVSEDSEEMSRSVGMLIGKAVIKEYKEWNSLEKVNQKLVTKEVNSLAIKVIKDNGGVTVLAHPGNNVKENKELLEKIISFGVEGIEVYSSYNNKNQINFYYDFALKNNLLMTCGSDFHGKTKPSISIGSVSSGDNEEKIIKELKSRIMFKK